LPVGALRTDTGQESGQGGGCRQWFGQLSWVGHDSTLGQGADTRLSER